jgi:ubiquinone/menaquinone biosynthesis C-methylase UbiE
MFLKIKDYVDLKEDESILDVGCGTGDFCSMFSGNYLGLDYSEKYVKYCSEKYPGKKFMQGNALELNFFPKSYDKVLLASFIHHFSDEEVRKMFKDISKIAGRRVIILEPLPLKNPFSWVLLKMDRGASVRNAERIKEFLSEDYNLVDSEVFLSGFYKLGIFVVEPKC